MTDSIGKTGGGLARAAIESALKRQAQALEQMRDRAGNLGLGSEGPGAGSMSATNGSPASVNPAAGSDFTRLLSEGLTGVDDKVKEADRMHLDVLEGKLEFHEVAAQLKESALSFDFAMQVRNKLIDAYREVMRMSV